MRRRRPNVWMLRVAILLVTVLLLGVLYTWRFDRWVGSLRFYDAAQAARFTNQEFPFLSNDQVVQLGAAHTIDDHPRSSYIGHSEEKPAGTVRIGVFGCSFVRGADAAPGNDVPSQLEVALRNAGLRNVEVLNFGVAAYGLHQSFLLWELVHENFELDYTVFNLFGFHADRDTTYVMLDDIFAPVHARYVLEDGSLRLVKVLGGNRLEASERYFRVLPAWRYLHYDVKAPPGLRALLPAGRTLQNPFYYRRDVAAEVEELNRLLVADLHRRAPNLVVLCDRGPSLKVLRALPDARSFVADSCGLQFARARGDVYMAPRGHLSGLGNLVVSRELGALLAGTRRLKVPSIEYIGREHRADIKSIDPLHKFKHVSITANGDPLGVLVVGNDDAPPWRLASLQKPAVSSLLDVSDRRHLAFIPLPCQLSNGTPVQIAVTTPDGSERVTIGRIVADTPVLGWMKRRRPTDGVDATGWTVAWDPAGSPLKLSLSGPCTPRDVQLWIGDTPVLRGLPGAEADGEGHTTLLRLEPMGSPLLWTRGHPEQSLRTLRWPSIGLIELMLDRGDDGAVRIPIRKFRITEIRLHDLTTSIDHPIAVPGF